MSKDSRRLRCAIYTRKSTEEGLDQAFNSLDAQREACAAYVMSQQHEGWTLASGVYDDGGYSGGSMERPALQQLLADVRAGCVDVVVVYKIDRLTRSLTDFTKIVEVLDSADASFVSVTQAFSTTTSMGRLTLNVLLSFAQFEREVIAERIRDKVAASKARGMWMGGPVALGYKVEERKLIVVPEEAATVRMIMERYLQDHTVRTLVEQLRREGVVSKKRVMRDGSVRGGIPLQRGALSWLLSNRIYVGETVHKGKAYPGEHQAIVERELFDAVQTKLAERTLQNAALPQRRRVTLLPGMIYDDRGRPMSPCHTRNHGRRYTYYASSMNDDAASPALRLPAGELEASVRTGVAGWLTDSENIRQLSKGYSAAELNQLIHRCSVLSNCIARAPLAEVRHALEQVELSVSVCSSRITASFSLRPVLELAGLESTDHATVFIEIPTTIASYGHEPRLRLEPTGNHLTPCDEHLIELIARAFSARDQLVAMGTDELEAMPVSRLRHLQRTARLSWLDPTTIRSILNGTQPRHLSARKLWRMADLPLTWTSQRQMLGIAAN